MECHKCVTNTCFRNLWQWLSIFCSQLSIPISYHQKKDQWQDKFFSTNVIFNPNHALETHDESSNGKKTDDFVNES